MKGKLVQKTITMGNGHQHLTEIIEDHRCDRCDTSLKGYDDFFIQPHDALEIEFHPYYGGYFDRISEEKSLSEKLYRRFWLCKDCAILLITFFPCLEVTR